MRRFVFWRMAALLLPAVFTAQAVGSEGALTTMRHDVRGTAVAGASPPAPAPAPAAPNDATTRRARGDSHDDEGLDGDLLLAGVWLSMYAAMASVALPIGMPVSATQDDMTFNGRFQRYPYHITHGSVVRPGTEAAIYETLIAGFDMDSQWVSKGPFQPRLSRWSGRFSTDYGSEFNDVDRVSGRLLFNTASRFGLDAEANYFGEHTHRGERDRLWLGDGNLIFRFAQGDRSEWRVGVGLNWLDAPQKTDYGFNFTYGFDLYPCRPWIMSLDIDWGTLGHTGLFRLRTTTGVVIWGLESYIGYEYLDIGRTDSNSLIAGVRLWF
ncbi:MAG: hypothetical protein U1E05_10865 [Patescibacteria group bacterium]|nr:hypothetical protein [Patescibacteria group bacterium]